FQLVATLASLKKPPSGGFFVPVCWESGLERFLHQNGALRAEAAKMWPKPPGARSRPPATPPL
ncbi:hypothetical protein P3771_31145, partial [Pseudomonas aeruginosa]|nr:hypothetical protein [Pseudomonas aeruginosa]